MDLDSRNSVLDCCLWNLDSRFQSLVGFLDSLKAVFKIPQANFSKFQIPQAKTSLTPESRFPYIGQQDLIMRWQAVGLLHQCYH